MCWQTSLGIRQGTLQKMAIFGTPIAWYKARIPGFARKSIREGASSLFGRGPERPKNVSCSRATQTCTSATLGLPWSKRLFWDSPALARKDYPLTRNYYENNSLRIIFRNFRGNLHSQNLQERKTFSSNYA